MSNKNEEKEERRAIGKQIIFMEWWKEKEVQDREEEVKERRATGCRFVGVLVDYIFTLVMSLEKFLVLLDKKVISR